jgi:hypothetical protein
MGYSDSSYSNVSMTASGAYQQMSVIPERFSGTSQAVPGRSIVPAEYQGTSAPAVQQPVTETSASPDRTPAAAEDERPTESLQPN